MLRHQSLSKPSVQQDIVDKGIRKLTHGQVILWFEGSEVFRLRRFPVEVLDTLDVWEAWGGEGECCFMAFGIILITDFVRPNMSGLRQKRFRDRTFEARDLGPWNVG